MGSRTRVGPPVSPVRPGGPQHVMLPSDWLVNQWVTRGDAQGSDPSLRQRVPHGLENMGVHAHGELG